MFRKVALPRNASLGEERIDDLTGLAFLHEASVLNTIKSRYVDNSIYTYSGIVLTAVNPYSRLPLYEREIIWAYRERHREELSPHLFAIAEDALCSLCLHHQSQSIIVSGESGAGKTISAKYIMRYLAEVCAMGTPSLLPLDEPKVRKTTVEDRVLATNPILEAFGNAKTIRNDNSSRFGKYIQIFFNDQDLIAGAAIKTYLLEKTRVVIQAEEERNFHIFYQLLAGCPEMERSELELYSWDEFEFLSRSGCGYIDGVDDVEEFKVTRDAMAIAGFTEDHQWNIFRVLAAILHLGNLQFTEDSDGHAHIKEAGALERVAKLLGVESAALEQDLIRRKIVAAHETVDAFNNLIQATASRDALSKLLYSSLFNHIVDGLNVNLMPTDKCDRFIGVLDIYGFERFNVNSFEQFCINYANEKLQNSFNKHVFELEQKLYDEEGIDWSFVHFYDNQKCIDLIESKLGVMDLLDEECRFPNGSDSSFVAKLYDRQGKMETGTFLLKPKISSEDKFTVKHFAYDVEYTTTGFIEKNRDQVPTELLELMSNSSNEFVKTLLQHSASSQSLLASRDSLSISRGRPSTGMTFKASLNSLMEVISSTRSHYIRCIKPNEGKEAMVFDAPFVVQQLCACGILETVRISSAGYPGRWPFQDFLDRFKLLSSDPISITTMDDTRMACCTLLSEFNMTNEQYQVGKTRVFMRAGVLAALEDARMRRLCTASTTIQSILRRLLAMTRMMEAFAAIMKIEQMIRMKLGWNHHRSLALARATDRIMAIIQRFIGIKLMDDGRRASNFISCIFKYFTTKLKSRELYKELSSQEIVNILRFFLTRRLYKAQIMISLAVQSRYRRNIAWLELLKLREEARSVEHLKETSEILEKRITDLEHQLKLANEHLTYERQVNGRLNADLVAARESTKVIIPDEDLQILRNELDDARLRIESFEKMIDSLEMANNELFERNEELAKQLRVYRLERTNADRLGKASQQQSLANIILRDTETPPRSLHHLRALSYDSRLEMLGDLALPEIMRPAEIRATSADMVLIMGNLRVYSYCRRILGWHWMMVDV